MPPQLVAAAEQSSTVISWMLCARTPQHPHIRAHLTQPVRRNFTPPAIFNYMPAAGPRRDSQVHLLSNENGEFRADRRVWHDDRLVQAPGSTNLATLVRGDCPFAPSLHFLIVYRLATLCSHRHFCTSPDGCVHSQLPARAQEASMMTLYESRMLTSAAAVEKRVTAASSDDRLR